jgi:uncharacterized protein (DUF2126 family)
VQLAADVEALDGPSGPTADFTDLHAWTEVFVPGAGWVGLDPTSGLFAGEGHIPLSCTPHPTSAAADHRCGRGVRGDVRTFSNVVRRIHEDPRVTKPYSDEQWDRIDALGRLVDERLTAGDVRLTMGGEPTFVSVDDMEGAEWNSAADGPMKKGLAADLVQRLRSRWTAGSLVHHGQGKWYPGEPLPRWQMAVLWRSDGVPLWSDDRLLANPAVPGKADHRTAAEFAATLAAELGVPAEMVLAAFEDPMQRALDEARRPIGEPPKKIAEPETDEERTARAVAKLDTRAARGRPTGWVLPLHWRAPEGRRRTPGWATARWRLRRGALFLLPGDSPIGYRLPIGSITWTPAPGDPEPSPFALPPLPAAGPHPAPPRRQRRVGGRRPAHGGHRRGAPRPRARVPPAAHRHRCRRRPARRRSNAPRRPSPRS